ncbi:MAG: serine kinase [Candidatus Zixiibacteriota bacterium]|nr:MAG: serine kinase [candidate division Zixibacteria bacterium]
MTVTEVIEKLGLHVLTSKEVSDTKVTGGYTCDLLSDVIANSKTGYLWITMQTHQNVLAVAKLKDLAGIIFVNGRQPDKDIIQKANEEHIAVLSTDESAFSISGQLYQLLK